MTAAKKNEPDSEHSQHRLEQLVTPIFDKETGRRMRVARMRKLMDQKELGQWLGVSQSVISDLELGQTTTGAFTLGRLRALFGSEVTNYILTGRKADQFETEGLTRTYWKARQASCGSHKTRKKVELPD